MLCLNQIQFTSMFLLCSHVYIYIYRLDLYDIQYRYYVAISDRKPKKKMGRIRGDILKSRRGSYKLARSMDNPAMTAFVSSKLVVTESEAPVYSFLLKPSTGKTHQIRVSMKSIGSAILGDSRYGTRAHSPERGYLHAAAIRFRLHGEDINIICAPEEGDIFTSAAFRRRFHEEWFSDETIHASTWFEHNALLTSSLEELGAI